jgi:hypothetical protein
MSMKIFAEGGAEHLVGRHFTYVLIENKDRGPNQDALQTALGDSGR